MALVTFQERDNLDSTDPSSFRRLVDILLHILRWLLGALRRQRRHTRPGSLEPSWVG